MNRLNKIILAINVLLLAALAFVTVQVYGAYATAREYMDLAKAAYGKAQSETVKGAVEGSKKALRGLEERIKKLRSDGGAP